MLQNGRHRQRKAKLPPWLTVQRGVTGAPRGWEANLALNGTYPTSVFGIDYIIIMSLTCSVAGRKAPPS